MKTLYLDCGMGAAGDMLTAALLELLPEAEQANFLEKLNQLGLPGVQFSRETVSRCGINGTHVTVRVHSEEETSEDMPGHMHEHCHEHEHAHCHAHEDHHEQEHQHVHEDACAHDACHCHDHGDGEGHHHHHHHHHSSLADIRHIVEAHLPVSEKVRQDILAVYGLIAEAESHAHGIPVSDIHFHEVGTLDAVADVTAVCLLMEALQPEEVVVSPIHVGSGQVRCAHGILPVPAPATAYILRDVPTYGGAVRGELCTPTGAALLRHFATSYGSMPVMRVEAIGYGMGQKEFEAANCVRAMLGEQETQKSSGTLSSAAEAAAAASGVTATAKVNVNTEAAAQQADDVVLALSCNLDDMTAEDIGFAMEELLRAGALDVWTSPIGMKKNRPAVMLSLLCHAAEREHLLRCIFLHTTTLGVREHDCRRWTLARKEECIETPYGTLRRKTASGYGTSRAKLEYDDVARIARERGLSLADVRKAAEAD